MPELHFSSWNAFFAMGGYGLFVWLSFGVTFALLGLLWWFSQAGHRQILKDIAAKQARMLWAIMAKQQRQDALGLAI